MKKIYLIDVSAMFFRAYYAIRPLTSPSGLPVNAIYGFMSMLTKIIKDEKPDYMVFCYDRKEPSFRKDMFEGYKAHRTEMPEDLVKQVPYIKQIAELLGIPALEIAPFEADDIIGTLALKAKRWGLEAVIVSGDKDFGQLIQDGVVLYDTMKDVRYDAKAVVDKWGVPPSKFIDYLAIVGDASDNVPGVKGVGEKGALKLLEQFSSLEDIYARIDEVESKSVRQKLIDSKEQALLSRKLVTIVTDVPVSEDLEAYHLKPIQREALRQFLKDLNFKTFEKSLLGNENGEHIFSKQEGAGASSNSKTSATSSALANPSSDVTGSTNQSNSMGSVELPQVPQEKSLSMDQARSIFKPGQEMWGLLTNRGLYFMDTAGIYSLEGSLETWGDFCSQMDFKWKGYDLKSFWHELKVSNPKIIWDGMLAAYILKAGDCSDFNKIYELYSGEVLPELASPAQIGAASIQLEKILTQRLEAIHGLSILQTMDLPLAPILYKMEARGILLDSELLAEQSKSLSKDIHRLEQEIHQHAGETFNIASPKQLAHILFEKMGLEAGKKTKTGFSTDNEVLQGLEHPIAKLVLEFRELSKLKSTYVDALPAIVSKIDGRIHTHLNQALTTTGRLSSNNPNLQNIPIRTPRGQEVRKAFVAAPGKKLLSADYSQIELRILAHISEDPNMCKAFADDLDIHAATAAEIYGVPLKDVTSELRRAAKAVNFGIAYGQGAFGLAENLGISRGEAKEIIDRYFERFKNVREYIDSTIKVAHEKGYVETLFGRRRYIDELSSKNMALKKFGERAAINAPIQGTASDLVRMAMINLDSKLSAPMLLQVHDELIFEDTEVALKEQAATVVKIMEEVASLRVPLKVNYAIGDNWDEAH